MESPSVEYSCRTSLEAGEPLWAHGTRADYWVLVGYEGPWERKALPFSDLPREVKDQLITLQKEGINARVQFIRRPGQPFNGSIPLYLARSTGEKPWLSFKVLDDYRDLLDLDLRQELEAASGPRGSAEPLFLICVNGRRDLCCTQNGQPVYEALAELAPNRTWQTTHLGGHRFAATGVVLPFGLHYGRLQAEDAEGLVRKTDIGRIQLDRYRGRTTLTQAAQAAAHQLRQELNLDGVDELRFVSEESMEEGATLVRFEAAGQDRLATRMVKPSTETYRVVKTTGDEEAAEVRHFEVLPAE